MRAETTDVRRFFQVTGVTPLTGKMRLMLETERGVGFAEASDLRMLAERGQFEDRPVTFFRIFDPTTVPTTDEERPAYDDIPPRLILHSGHIDGDNAIVLDGQPSPG